MAYLLSDIEGDVLDALEESRSLPKFWSLQNEIRPFIVEGLYEMALISGDPEIRSSTPFAVAQNVTLQTMPTAAIALVRVEADGKALDKATLWDMDRMSPGWEAETGTVLKKWFPYGLGQWGVYPKLTAPVNVVLTYIALPVVIDRPYAGTEPVALQEEYFEGINSYAAHAARLKEGGVDFTQSLVLYDNFLGFAKENSRFAIRKGSLRFTTTFGAKAKVTEVTTR